MKIFFSVLLIEIQLSVSFIFSRNCSEDRRVFAGLHLYGLVLFSWWKDVGLINCYLTTNGQTVQGKAVLDNFCFIPTCANIVYPLSFLELPLITEHQSIYSGF